MFMKKTYLTALLSCSALAIALTTFGIEQMPRDESGNMTAVVGYGPAFYLWLSSMLVILGATLIDILKVRTSNNPAAGNAGIESRLTLECQCPGVTVRDVRADDIRLLA
jgi:hypothetical protein